MAGRDAGSPSPADSLVRRVCSEVNRARAHSHEVWSGGTVIFSGNDAGAARRGGGQPLVARVALTAEDFGHRDANRVRSVLADLRSRVAAIEPEEESESPLAPAESPVPPSSGPAAPTRAVPVARVDDRPPAVLLDRMHRTPPGDKPASLAPQPVSAPPSATSASSELLPSAPQPSPASSASSHSATPRRPLCPASPVSPAQPAARASRSPLSPRRPQPGTGRNARPSSAAAAPTSPAGCEGVTLEHRPRRPRWLRFLGAGTGDSAPCARSVPRPWVDACARVVADHVLAPLQRLPRLAQHEKAWLALARVEDVAFDVPVTARKQPLDPLPLTRLLVSVRRRGKGWEPAGWVSLQAKGAPPLALPPLRSCAFRARVRRAALAPVRDALRSRPGTKGRRRSQRGAATTASPDPSLRSPQFYFRLGFLGAADVLEEAAELLREHLGQRRAGAADRAQRPASSAAGPADRAQL